MTMWLKAYFKFTLKRLQDFCCACAACCWGTVLNPGLIAVRVEPSFFPPHTTRHKEALLSSQSVGVLYLQSTNESLKYR